MTVFAFLAGVGTFGPQSAVAGADDSGSQATAARPATARSEQARNVAQERLTGTRSSPSASPSTSPSASTSTGATRQRTADDPDGSEVDAPVPTGSGTGRRVVFDMSDQRVWLVGDGGRVLSSYLVSGSVTDNLGPGSYRVYSRSLHAVGVDDSGVMQYFVRFTRGQNAAIGFHDIPQKDGRLVQTPAQLGTPQSHGCIRQQRPDAIALWRFAPIGTPVDVVA